MKRHIWTTEQIEQLKELYQDTNNNEIAKILGLSYRTVLSKAYSFGLRKSADFLQNHCNRLQNNFGTGIEHRFPKGYTPFNKGKKLTEYAKPESIAKIQKTQFQKGQEPKNTKFDNCISTRYNDGRPSLMIRISKSNWKYLSHYNWEKENPKVAKGNVLIHIDGNPLNCAIENLKEISKAENARRNQIHHYPEDLKQKIKALNKLKKTIKTASKDEQ